MHDVTVLATDVTVPAGLRWTNTRRGPASGHPQSSGPVPPELVRLARPAR